MIIEGPPGPTNIYIYMYIYFFHNVIHIYEISVVHLSFLYMYLPCDEMFLKYSWAFEHNIQNVEVFR